MYVYTYIHIYIYKHMYTHTHMYMETALRSVMTPAASMRRREHMVRANMVLAQYPQRTRKNMYYTNSTYSIFKQSLLRYAYTNMNILYCTITIVTYTHMYC